MNGNYLTEMAEHNAWNRRAEAARVDLEYLGCSFVQDVAAVLRALSLATCGEIEVYAYWPPGAERARLAEVACHDGRPHIRQARTVSQLRALLARVMIADGGGLAVEAPDQEIQESFIRVRTDRIGTVTGARYAMPGADVLGAVVELGEWPGIPVLRGIARLPLFRADGSICQDEGFDDASGWYCIATANLASPLEAAVRAFAAQHGRWLGPLTDLREVLGWPGTEKGLSNELKRAAPQLAAAGIASRPAGKDPRTRRRIWEITPSHASQASNAALSSGNEAKGLLETLRNPSEQEVAQPGEWSDTM